MWHKIVLEIEDYTPKNTYEGIDKELMTKDIHRWVRERIKEMQFTKVKIKSIKEIKE